MSRLTAEHGPKCNKDALNKDGSTKLTKLTTMKEYICMFYRLVNMTTEIKLNDKYFLHRWL